MTPAEILRTLVSFDTTSRNSNLELVGWVEGYLAGHGVSSERVYDATGTKANLWATIGPDAGNGYILSGHTDVVPVDGQDWDTDPFDLTEKDGRLYGRGACDMKGFLACVLSRVPDLVAAGAPVPFHIAFSYDEEVGCVGVHTLLEELKARGQKAAACFVGEPTGMQVIIGHKSKLAMEAHIAGFSAHSSLAPQGVNAVDAGARLAVFIRDMADRLAAAGTKDELYDVGFTTAHTGVLQGGTALNIVPDACRMMFEVRAVAEDDPRALMDEIIAYAKTELEPAMQAVRPDTGFTFHEISLIEGLETEADAPVVTLAKRLAGRNDHAKVAYGTEAGLFTRYLGTPTVVCGPGSIEQAHKPNEFIAASELDACHAFLGRLIAHAKSGGDQTVS